MSEQGSVDNDALIDGALAEIGRKARSLGACSICWALVAPGLRDQHLDWHASLAREIKEERLPQVYGGRPIPPTAETDDGSPDERARHE